MNPMPTQRWYDSFYAEEFWEEKAASQGASDVRIHKRQWRKEIGRAREIYRFLGDHGGKIGGNGSVLEIGCAYGLVSRWLGERLSLTPLGVEPSTAAREFAERHAGVAIVAQAASGLESWTPTQSLRLVIMAHVLENICEPRRILEILKRKLAPGGLLMIETPNSLTRRGWSIFHPFIYSRHALSHMLTSSGFDVVVYEASGQPRTRWLPLYQRFLATPASRTPGESVVQDAPSAAFPLLRRVGTAASYVWGHSTRLIDRQPALDFDEFDRRLLDSVQASVSKAGPS